jgi:hypothetical protein
MPLFMGNWRFFVGGPEAQLVLSELQPAGRFKVSANVSTQFAPPPNNQFGMSGEGFWDELGQTVSFTLNGAPPPPPGGGPAGPVLPTTLVFAGHQVAPFTVVADPAQDQLWTLVGEFRHALIALPPLASPPAIPNESARRSVFGWYAQITQIV